MLQLFKSRTYGQDLTPILLLWIAVGLLPVEAGARAVGFEVQRYPVGAIATVTGRVPLGGRSELLLGAGYNDADRENNGEFDDEQAEGPGVSVGFRHHREADRTGWSFGARLDVWDLEVDWIDQLGTVGETRGTSDTLVLQPTGVVGYAWNLGDAGWQVEASAAFGAEINVDTDGPDVGEGAIGLAGVSLLRRF